MMEQYLTQNITYTSKTTLVEKNVTVLNDKLLPESFSII